jgi:DNA-binding FadR family transcriptional regulator
MVFTQLVAPTLKELFIQELESSILSGELPIGTQLPAERELAAQMGVSRAVVNGGIRELTQMGFLEVVPRKGTFVANYKKHGRLETLQSILKYNGGHFDAAMLRSIYEVRTCIERHMAELAARNHDVEALGELRRQLLLLSETDDVAVLAEETAEFYHLLAVATGNIIYPLNIQAYRPLYIALFRRVYEHTEKEERLSRMKKLLIRLGAGDVEGSVACTTEIIAWGRNVIMQNSIQSKTENTAIRTH